MKQRSDTVEAQSILQLSACALCAVRDADLLQKSKFGLIYSILVLSVSLILTKK